MGRFETFLYRNPLAVLLLAVAGVLLVGVLDYVTGSELSFFLFYLGPIAFAVWFHGVRFGFVMVLLSAIAWLAADIGGAHHYTESWIQFWNTMIRLLVFGAFAGLLAKLKTMLENEERLADTDPLTRLFNRRAFSESLEREVDRARRYQEAFTLAYIDLDNFKQVNDRMGHDVGDQLLKFVAAILDNHTRSSDIVARLGGDEFAILFPQTYGASAREGLDKLRRELNNTMEENEWPVTFSIGAVAFSRPEGSIRDILKIADDLMYKVKKQGKNGLLFEQR